jgi:integrase
VSQGWIKSLPVAASTARLIIVDVSQVYKAAIDDGRIAKNPLRASSIQRPAAQKRQAVALTAEQVIAMETGLPAHLSAMAPLGASCGHRKGELFAASVGDIDFLRKTCHIEWQVKVVDRKLYFAPTKNGAIRDVPVGDYAIWAVSAHLARRPAVAVTLPVMHEDGSVGKPMKRELIFTRTDGLAHTRNSVQWGWDSAWKQAGIVAPPYARGWHSLRHTAASWWLSGGLSLAKAAALLGDTKETVLAVYAHFMPADDDLAREIINGQLAAPDGKGDQPAPSDAAAEL